MKTAPSSGAKRLVLCLGIGLLTKNSSSIGDTFGCQAAGKPVGAFHNLGIRVSIWLWGVVQIRESTSFRYRWWSGRDSNPQLRPEMGTVHLPLANLQDMSLSALGHSLLAD